MNAQIVFFTCHCTKLWTFTVSAYMYSISHDFTHAYILLPIHRATNEGADLK